MARFIYDEAVIRFEAPESQLAQATKDLEKLTSQGAVIDSEAYWELDDGGQKVTPKQVIIKAVEVEYKTRYQEPDIRAGAFTGETDVEWRCPYTPDNDVTNILQEEYVNPLAFKLFKREHWSEKVLTVEVSGILKKLGKDVTTPTLENGDILIGFGKADSTVISKVYDPDLIVGDPERELIRRGECDLCRRSTERNLLYLIQRPDGSRYTMGSTCALKAFGVNLKSIMSAYIKEVESLAQELLDDIDDSLRGCSRRVRDYSLPRYDVALAFIGVDGNEYADKVLGVHPRTRWQLTFQHIKKPDQEKIQAVLEEALENFMQLREEHPENGYYDNTYVTIKEQPGRISLKWATSILKTLGKLKATEEAKKLEVPDKPVEAEVGVMTEFEGFHIVYTKPPNMDWTFPAWFIVAKRDDGQKATFSWRKDNVFEVGDTVSFRAKVKNHEVDSSRLTHVKNIEKVTA